MKFLCVPCDSPMKLQTVGPPEAGSLSVVYACPECGYEMAMLTNPFETQLVQSLGVRIGPAEQGGASTTSGSRCPFPAMMPATEGNEAPAVHTGRSLSDGPPPRKPGSRTFQSSFVPWRGLASRDLPGIGGRWKWTKRSSTRPVTSSACEARLRRA